MVQAGHPQNILMHYYPSPPEEMLVENRKVYIHNGSYV